MPRTFRVGDCILIPDGRIGRVRDEQAIAESFVYSFRLVMLVAAGLALAGAVTAFLTIEGKGLPERHQPG